MNVLNDDKELRMITSQWSDWVLKQTEFKRIDNKTIQVLTSFVDAFGDGILFTIISNDDGTYTVTDNGYSIWNLEVNGINVSNKKSNRYRILYSTVKPYDFKITDNKVILKSAIKIDNLPQAITDFIQILINVSDIAFMNRNNTASMFLEDAKNYFSENKDRFFYQTSPIVLGKTNQQYKFDFNFIYDREFKLTKMYNTISKNSMESIIGIYSDTKETIAQDFGDNPSFNILVNGIDNKERVYVEGLRSHDINVVNFQDKEEVDAAFAIA